METMIHGKYVGQGEDLSEILPVREAIFGVREEEKDKDAINLLVCLEENAAEDGTPIGCGRLNLDLAEFRFEIDSLGIKEEFRKNGFGEFALRALVDKVNQCGADCVYIRKADLKTEEAERFFRKMFFEPAEDEAYLCAKIDSFHTCCH